MTIHTLKKLFNINQILITMLQLVLALILGSIIFVLREYNKSPVGRFLSFIGKKENYLPAILNFATGLVILFAWRADPSSLAAVGITKVTFLTAAILGFTGNGIWSAITEGTARDVKTKVGRNAQ